MDHRRTCIVLRPWKHGQERDKDQKTGTTEVRNTVSATMNKRGPGSSDTDNRLDKNGGAAS
jgi:hypothetical protein